MGLGQLASATDWLLMLITLIIKALSYIAIVIIIVYMRKIYEESVVDRFKSNLLLMIFWLHIINYNS